MGPYYKNKNLYAGDEIVFEKRVIDGNTKYYIFAHKKFDNLVMQKSKYGFEILTPERLKTFREKTDFYDIRISGENLRDFLDKNNKGVKAVEAEIIGDAVLVSAFCGWKKYEYEMEE